MMDTETVFQWACNHAAEYGFDTDNFFAVGDSAGGHLLSLYTDALSNSKFRQQFDFIKDKPMTLRGVGLNCGKYNLDDDEFKYKLLRSGFLPNKGTKEEIKMVDATAHVSHNFPPAFIVTCVGDFLWEQANLIKAALDAAGVKNELHCYGTTEKPLWHVFHCSPTINEASQGTDDECEFFRSLRKV